MTSFVETTSSRAAMQPDDIAYRFLVTGDVDGEIHEMSFGQLAMRARAIGGWLQNNGFAGGRALLLYPTGLEFTSGFMGCLFAGVTAIPCPAPAGRQSDRALTRLRQLVADAGADVVLSAEPILSAMRSAAERIPELAPLTWIATEDVPDETQGIWRDPGAGPETIAFLQYTSGSTSAPRGVMVSHGNLLDNQRIIAEGWGHTPELAASWDGDLTVSWLPVFHDLGLIGMVLHAVYIGRAAVIFSPQHFVEKPERWLTAVSRYRAHTSGGPNFGYELCLRRATPELLERLDLRHWKVAFNGAEPVRAQTLRRFAQVFGPAGFQREALCPGYGLAEATLMVTSRPAGAGPVIGTVPAEDRRDADGAASRRGTDRSTGPASPGTGPAASGPASRSREVAGVGWTREGMSVLIVDPERKTQCPDGQVGEIWVAGASVAHGYWNNAQATQDVFRAKLADGRTGFLRTGDLGFVRDRELFVTGRRKDVLIIDGRNHYPQDLELTAETSHPAVRPGCVAAFPVDGADGEQAVIVAEAVLKGASQAEAEAAIRGAISAEHGLALRSVLLIQRGTIFKTSSGKIQRSACRAAFLDGSLALLAPLDSQLDDAKPVMNPALAKPLRDAAGSWLVAEIARRAGLDPSRVAADRPIAEYGLSSRELVELAGELSAIAGRRLEPALLYDYPTISQIAQALDAGIPGAPATADEPAQAAPRASEPIAVVSMACRFPGGINDPGQLWQFLSAGGDAITDFPADRAGFESVYDPDPDATGKSYVRQGGFLTDIDAFDPQFFGITPREAVSMDPQQRLLLELAWEALERAGIVPASLSGTMTGVYVGMFGSDYVAGSSPDQLDGYAGTGSALSVASGRLAYTLGLVGPAVTVDTACSSSLLALHLAVSALRAGECRAALAGGATLMVTPRTFIEFSRLRGLSSSGRCRSFSDDADGTAFAEGACLVLLKRLSDAQRDGDDILAVVRGTAVNQDGRSQGLSAPHGPSQQQVIRRALRLSAVTPADIDYIEAHGTGTRLGDPIEANALAQVFGAARPQDRPLYLGSVKSNLGHLQAAAGLAGLIKVVLSLQREQLPRTLHAVTPTRHVDWDAAGLRLVQEPLPWRRGSRPRRAGVSSFGISGTNVHVVLEEAPHADRPAAPAPPPASGPAPASQLCLVTARSDAALGRQAQQLAAYLAGQPSVTVPDVAYSLARTRSHFERRAVVVAADRDGLLAGLDAVAAGVAQPGVVLPPAADSLTGKVAFVFPGHSARWAGMATGLMAGSADFAQALMRCDEAIRRHAGWSVISVLHGAAGAPDLDRVDVAQPVLFAVDSALAMMWRALGVEPDAVIGHSLGEIAAAYVAGILALDQAAALVTRRGLALRPLAGRGGLLSVGLPPENARDRLAAYSGRLEIAAINHSRSVTVSGDMDALADLQARLDDEQIPARRVPIGFASHSFHMDAVRDELQGQLASIAGVASATPLYSTVLAEPVSGDALTADYWLRNLRDPVRFAATVRRMLDDGFRYFVEVSPHRALVPSVMAVAAEAGVPAFAVGSLQRDEDDVASMLRSLACLVSSGHAPDWPKTVRAGSRVALPTYAFDRSRYWLPPASAASAGPAGLPLVHLHIEASDDPGRHIVQADIDLRDNRFAYLADHRIAGEIWLPAAVYLEMVLEACRAALPAMDDGISLAGVRFDRPVQLRQDEPVRLQLIIQPATASGARAFTIASRPLADPLADPQAPWTVHVSGEVRPGGLGEAEAPEPVSALRARCPAAVGLPEHYAALAAAGVEYGDEFRGLEAGWKGTRESLGRLSPPPPSPYILHPALLDAAFQTAALPDDTPDGQAYVPVTVGRMHVSRACTRPAWASCRLRSVSSGTVVLDLRLLDDHEQPVAEISGFTLARLPSRESSLYEVEWRTRPPAAAATPDGAWLVLADESGAGTEISRRLQAVPHVVARCGSGFSEEGPGRYRLDPQDPEHFTRLLDVAFPAAPPAHIIQLFSLDAPAIDSPKSLAEAARLCCTATLHLVRAVTQRAWHPAPRLFLVTRASQAAGGSTQVTQPQQALGWGFGMAIAQEHPELRTTLVDLPPAGGADALWTQLRHADDELCLALRGSGRLVPRLVPARPGNARQPIRADRTYLVTGGLGGLGQVVAERLVRRGARHVALLGRSEPAGAASRWISELRARGAAVHVLQADVADRAALERALSTLRSAAPPVGGVVHAAGVLDDATSLTLAAQRIPPVLAPKVLGAALLAELVPEAGFLIMFSSAAGLLGSAGQSSYAAANACLDALAHHLREGGRSVLSLDWGPWSDVGMVTGPAVRAAAASRLGLPCFTPDQGGELFDRVLGSDRCQLVPIMLDREALGRNPDLVLSRPLLSELAAATPSPPRISDLAGQIRSSSVTPQERRGLLEEYLRGAVARIIGGDVPETAVTTPLKELALDSLMLVTLHGAVARELGVELSSAEALAATDIHGLAGTILAALGTARDRAAVTPAAAPCGEPDPGSPVPDVALRPATRDIMRLLRTQRQGIPAAAHHIGFAVRLTRPVTPDRLTQILTGLAARHAALRTAIVADAGHGQQLEIRREPAGPLLRWSPVAGHVDAGRRLRELMEPPFDLDTAPLWRFELLEPESGEQILLYGAHHAVCDAQSLALVMAELGAELSGARLSNVASNRDIDRLPEAQPAAGADPLAAQWREEFTGCRRLDLALARARPATRTFRAGTLFADMPGGLLEQVTAQASQLAITPAAFCLGTLTVLLARLRGHRRFVLAVPVDTRMHAGALDALGFFGIPIPFPAEVAAEEPIADVLRRTDTRMNRVLEKGASFFDAMPALIDEGLYRADAPLVEVYFNFIRPHTLTAPGLEVVQAGTGYSDLDLMVTVASDLNHVRLDYNLDIIDEPSCGRFAHDYLRLLAEVAGGPALQTTARPAPAPPSGPSIALAATFALGNMPALLRGALRDDGPGGSDRPELTVDEAPYHQVLASLQDPAGIFARPSTVAGVVLLRARDLERFGPVSDDLLTELADEYPAAVRSLSQRTGVPLIVGFAPAHPADARLGEWEQHLAARLAEQPGVAVVRHDEWGRQYPVSSRFDEDTDALAHLPFQPEFQAAMALTVADVLRAVLRPPPKVIAVDGDETLWGGIAGEIGPDQVELAGPRAVLARRLLDWRAAGVLLVLVSNNDEATVQAVLDRPESLLRADSFSVISLGWQPKGERLADAARDLGLGLDSFLFLDDNPAEIAAVRSVLPEVLSVTCPAAGELDGFLARLWPIIPRAATAEDSRRAEFYRQEQARSREHTQAGFAGFLRRLQLEVDISPLSAATMKRSVQLSRRTSQFNLRPAALDEAALTAWQDDGEVWTASARDRFGDYGQVGLLVIRQDGDTLEVVAWMLSCRALGRGVEERLLAWLADRADALRCPAVRLIAEHTPRNVPARRIVAALGGTDIDSPVLDVVTQPSCLRAFRSWATGSGEDMRAHHG